MSQASRTFRTFSAPSYQKWAFCHFMPTDSPTSANHCRPGSFQVNKNWAEKTRLTRPDKKQEIGYNKKEHSGKSTAKLAPPAVSLAWMFFSFWLREPDLNWRPSGYEPDELPSCSIPRYISSASLVSTCIVYHNSAHLSTKNQNFKIKQCFMYVIQNNQKYNQHYSI